MSRPLKVVAVLPKIEYFSSQQGGALATWVHQVYRRIPSWDVKVVTIAADNLYSIPPTSICRVGKILDGLHSPIANRSLGRLLEPIKLWLRTGYNRRAADLCKSFKPDTIHIQN